MKWTCFKAKTRVHTQPTRAELVAMTQMGGSWKGHRTRRVMTETRRGLLSMAYSHCPPTQPYGLAFASANVLVLQPVICALTRLNADLLHDALSGGICAASTIPRALSQPEKQQQQENCKDKRRSRPERRSRGKLREHAWQPRRRKRGLPRRRRRPLRGLHQHERLMWRRRVPGFKRWTHRPRNLMSRSTRKM